MDKKGAELALNAIIIAVLALLVLLVMAFIFTGKTQIFSQGTDACATKQGSCVDMAERCSGPIINAKDCADKDPPQKCCVKVG
jgi:hypothetical protein